MAAKIHYKEETEISSTIFNNVFSHFLWERIFRTSGIHFSDVFPVHHRYLFYVGSVKLITNDGPLTSIYLLQSKIGNPSYVYCKYCYSLHNHTGRDICEVNHKKMYNPYKYSEQCWQITWIPKGFKSIFIKMPSLPL